MRGEPVIAKTDEEYVEKVMLPAGDMIITTGSNIIEYENEPDDLIRYSIVTSCRNNLDIYTSRNYCDELNLTIDPVHCLVTFESSIDKTNYPKEIKQALRLFQFDAVKDYFYDLVPEELFVFPSSSQILPSNFSGIRKGAYCEVVLKFKDPISSEYVERYMIDFIKNGFYFSSKDYSSLSTYTAFLLIGCAMDTLKREELRKLINRY